MYMIDHICALVWRARPSSRISAPDYIICAHGPLHKIPDSMSQQIELHIKYTCIYYVHTIYIGGLLLDIYSRTS